jgi:hypothetical protein
MQRVKMRWLARHDVEAAGSRSLDIARLKEPRGIRDRNCLRWLSASGCSG